MLPYSSRLANLVWWDWQHFDTFFPLLLFSLFCFVSFHLLLLRINLFFLFSCLVQFFWLFVRFYYHYYHYYHYFFNLCPCEHKNWMMKIDWLTSLFFVIIFFLFFSTDRRWQKCFVAFSCIYSLFNERRGLLPSTAYNSC